MKRSLLVAGAVATIGLAGLGAGAAFAASPIDGPGTLIDKIAQRFNLKKEDVQKVFDEERTAHQAEHEQNMTENLQKAVSDGKLTRNRPTKLLPSIKRC
jgi:hypothetical protein